MDQKKAVFLVVAIITLLFQTYVLINNEYWNAVPKSDSVLHIVWGLCIFLGLVAYRNWRPQDAILGVITWQFLFEAGEMIDDFIRFQSDWPWYKIDHFFFDGIKDTIMNVLGAYIAWLVLLWLGERFLLKRKTRTHTYLTLFCLSMLPMVVLGSILKMITGVSYDDFATLWILWSAIALGLFIYIRSKIHPKTARKAIEQE